MSRVLIGLLGVKERDFQAYIRRLEHVTMNQGIDIRLSSRLVIKARAKALQLSIDEPEQNSTALYDSLKDTLRNHDQLLQQKLRFKDDSSKEVVAKRLALTTTKLSRQERALCLTPAATKRVLKAAPPNKTLRMLKLRSLDSVVKRFNPRMLYAIACMIEGRSWQSQVHAKMKRIGGKDIVWDSVEAIAVPTDWYDKLSSVFTGKGFYHVNRETGALLVMPVVNHKNTGSTLLALSLLLQSAHRLAMVSLPYKRRSFIRGRESVLPEIAHGLQPQLTHIHGLLPTWPVVYQLFGANHVSEEDHGADLLLGDLDWESIETKLAKLVPEIGFWLDTHYLALPTDAGPVSMHIVDVASSVVGSKSFTEQHTAHFESSLWNELQLSYLKEEAMARSLMKQLMSSEELMVY